METKKLIQIAVIVAAFGGSGIVLYNGFFKQSTPAASGPAGAASVSAPGGGGGSAGPILPDGRTLDFSAIESSRFNFGAVQYEAVDTSTEVGVPISSLIVQQSAGPQP